MKRPSRLESCAVFLLLLAPLTGWSADVSSVLPDGVRPVWDLSKAFHETTPNRERISLNGLWQWQPANAQTEAVPTEHWGYFKVPGAWPGITDYMQKDSQTVYSHPDWKDQELGNINAAWYQREFVIPRQWSGRRISVSLEYLNSLATVFVMGRRQERFVSPVVSLI